MFPPPLGGGAYTQLNRKKVYATVFSEPKISRETCLLLERRLQVGRLHLEFSDCLPRYRFWQTRWEDEAWVAVLKDSYINPFSVEERIELHWELAFWVMKGLYAHYQKKEPDLSWEEFLSLIQKREDIRRGAAFVACFFPEVSRPDLTMWKHWHPSRHSDHCDYHRQKGLFQQIETLSLIVPAGALEQGAVSMATHLAIALYIKKKKDIRYCLMTWYDFREMLESEPILKQILSQQVRWMYAMNPKVLQKLWESERVTIPPLRTK